MSRPVPAPLCTVPACPAHRRSEADGNGTAGLRRRNAAMRRELARLAAELHAAMQALRQSELRAERALLAASRDGLTGLVNRRVLDDRLQQAEARAVRHGTPFALLLIDLDGFKAVNDRHGHQAGDAVLRAVAQRLMACTRGADTVCRLGGDEFVVLLGDGAQESAAATVAAKIAAAMRTPLQVENLALGVGLSIGAACYPRDGASAAALIGCADRRMYAAKRGGRSPTRRDRLT